MFDIRFFSQSILVEQQVNTIQLFWQMIKQLKSKFLLVWQRAFTNAVLFISLIIVSCAANASFDKTIQPKWAINNPMSKAVIYHDEWQSFLNNHVITNKEGINLVNYAQIGEEDSNLLNTYIKKLSQIDIGQYNRAEQLAYWLNLYNALVVQTVSSYYPVSSIEDINISPGLFSIGPWGKKIISIQNTELSLEEIQNHIIRPIWNDQRTLYAMNNAAIGAANLNKQAFHGSTLENELNKIATEYINSPRAVQVIDNELILSKTYDWFKEDFGVSDEDIILHLKFFAKEPLLCQLKQAHHIDSYIYNWHLNQTTAN